MTDEMHQGAGNHVVHLYSGPAPLDMLAEALSRGPVQAKLISGGDEYQVTLTPIEHSKAFRITTTVAPEAGETA